MAAFILMRWEFKNLQQQFTIVYDAWGVSFGFSFDRVPNNVCRQHGSSRVLNEQVVDMFMSRVVSHF